MNALSQLATDARGDEATGELTLEEFTDFFHEIEEQPAWRAKADREMEYVDGNQLSADILQKQREIGMPPAIEPVIGPAISSVCGLEAKSRADWRVMPDSDQDGDEVASALNFKLNQAERKSKADKACSDAYRTQISVGVGWVEVSRDPNPFQYPYRCKAIHRNEIFWDMLAVEPDLSDARYLIRRRWLPTTQAKLAFPGKKTLIAQAASGWPNYEGGGGTIEGGDSTDLMASWDQQRGWSIETQQWKDGTGKRVCLFEVWYRRWIRMLVLKTPDGRVVEFDKKNAVHAQLVAIGATVPEEAIVPKMRRSIWMGPHRLVDEATPYRHQKFPYVPFWGQKEDRTGVPYGLVRGMIYQQDNINATNSKLRWGLAAVRTTRTKGAVAGTDEQFRQEVARVDADIVLNAEHMATQGATFKVERDFELNNQHWQMLQDARLAVERVSGISASFMGSKGSANSGIQEATQVEQSTQALADINDNFATARAEVGDILLSLIVEDMIGKEEVVKIKGDPLKDEVEVRLNTPATDAETGIKFLSNDVERTKLKVAINDVPSTPSYRSQQLSSMSEAFKSMPPQFQQVAMPYLIALMDLPNREDIIKAVREAAQQETPEQIEERIAKAVADARMADARDLKLQELAMKYSPEKLEAEIRDLVAKTFKTNVEALYSSNQAAATIAMNPAIAPVADVVAEAAGYQPPVPGAVDPNLSAPTSLGDGGPSLAAPDVEQPLADDVTGTPGVAENTSPALPPVPQAPASPMDGIETQRFTDNAPQ